MPPDPPYPPLTRAVTPKRNLKKNQIKTKQANKQTKMRTKQNKQQQQQQQEEKPPQFFHTSSFVPVALRVVFHIEYPLVQSAFLANVHCKEDSQSNPVQYNKGTSGGITDPDFKLYYRV